MEGTERNLMPVGHIIPTDHIDVSRNVAEELLRATNRDVAGRVDELASRTARIKSGQLWPKLNAALTKDARRYPGLADVELRDIYSDVEFRAMGIFGPSFSPRKMAGPSKSEMPAYQPTPAETLDDEKHQRFLDRARQAAAGRFTSIPGRGDLPADISLVTEAAALLGLKMATDDEVASSVAIGFPVTVLDHLEATGLGKMELQDLVVPARTLARRRKEGRLNSAESDAAFRIARVIAAAQRTLGNRASAVEWLRSSKERLSGKRPLDVLGTEAGARQIEGILHAADYGQVA